MFELKIGKTGVIDAEDSTEIEKGNKCTFSFLKRLLDGISDIVKKIEIKATPEEGVQIQVIDNLQVSILNVFLKKTAFDNFRCDRRISLGVDLVPFVKILRNIPVTSSSHMLLSANDEATKMQIVWEEEGKKHMYSINLLTIANEEYEMDDKRYSATLCLPTQDFIRAIRALGTFGEVLRIHATPERGFVFTQESEIGNSEVNYMQSSGINENSETKDGKEEDRRIQVEVQEEVEISLPYRFIALFGKFSLLGERITIGMERGSPLFITVSFPFGYLKYYVAPRNENEE